MAHRVLAAACGLALMAFSPGAGKADDIVEQLELALEYYQEGDYAAAITELEFAIGDLRALIAGQYAAAMPEALPGWIADDATTEGGAAFMGGGSIVTRNYRQQGGDGRIEAQLVVDNPMIQGMAAMFANPALLAAQPNTERIRVGRDAGMLQWEPERRSGEVTLMLGNRVLVKLEGYGLDDKQVLVDKMRSWDLDAVKRIAGM